MNLEKLKEKDESIIKPKKCLTAYMIFVHETRPKLVKKFPRMTAIEIM
jgi:hypothetical protein